jgi:hypothetical protein
MERLPDEKMAHYVHSTLRERIVEHVFVGDALRRLWQRGVTDVEVLRSEFDAGGYDLVMSFRKIVRHIQFKTSMVGGKAADVKASLKLKDKPSGCIIWILVTPELQIHSFLWLGSPPGQPLPDIQALRIARHTKANAEGIKAHRPDQRIIPRGRFTPLGTLDEVLDKLFGSLT